MSTRGINFLDRGIANNVPETIKTDANAIVPYDAAIVGRRQVPRFHHVDS
ncbi:DUF768 domain-containing protein [Mesorhizobium sp. B2-4-9]|nr:DUF768 domain-containing protein [Mesorhizobium sp. B2-4-9]